MLTGALAVIAFLLLVIWFSLLRMQTLLKKLLDRPDIDTVRARRAAHREELAKHGLSEDD
jgi:hypothetical protein